MSSATLALLGGAKTVTIENPEQWRPPIEREIELCTQIIRERSFSATNSGVPAQFEQGFKELVGTEFCLSQNNGTSTLLAAYFAVGVGPGDEVITPSYGWICTFGPLFVLGARPIFCEIDPYSTLADPNDIEKRITTKTKAICIPHLFGNVFDLDRVLTIGKKHNIPIIEDCSHSHCAQWDGKNVGSLGDVGCFSMQGGLPGGKPVAGGEAGVVVTNNRDYYERILVMGHLNRRGILDELTDPDYKSIGSTGFAMVKFRPNALSMALGLVALESVKYRSERIWENYQKIEEGLKGLPLRLAGRYPKAKPGGFHAQFRGIYSPDELDGLSARKFIEAINAEGATLGGNMYPLWHLNPIFAKKLPIYRDGRGPLSDDYRAYKQGDLPITEKIHPNIISFPALMEPKEGYMEQYITAIRKVVDNYKQLL